MEKQKIRLRFLTVGGKCLLFLINNQKKSQENMKIKFKLSIIITLVIII
jgi:hypothetical protein